MQPIEPTIRPTIGAIIGVTSDSQKSVPGQRPDVANQPSSLADTSNLFGGFFDGDGSIQPVIDLGGASGQKDGDPGILQSIFGKIGARIQSSDQKHTGPPTKAKEGPSLIDTLAATAVVQLRARQARQAPTPSPAAQRRDPVGDPRYQAREQDYLVRKWGNIPTSEAVDLPEVIGMRTHVANLPPSMWEDEAQRIARRAQEADRNMTMKNRAIDEARTYIARLAQQPISSADWNFEAWQKGRIPAAGPVEALWEGLKGEILVRATRNRMTAAGRNSKDDEVKITAVGIEVINPSENRPRREIPWDGLRRYEIDVRPSNWVEGMNQALGRWKQPVVFPLGLGVLRITDPQQGSGQTEVDVNMINPLGFVKKMKEVEHMYRISLTPHDINRVVPTVRDLIPVKYVRAIAAPRDEFETMWEVFEGDMRKTQAEAVARGDTVMHVNLNRAAKEQARKGGSRFFINWVQKRMEAQTQTAPAADVNVVDGEFTESP